VVYDKLTQPAYPAARAVARRVWEHFVYHTKEARARGESRIAAVPDDATIEAIIGAAFWASIR
jgi:hypothetical protein